MLLAIDIGNTQTVIGVFDDLHKLFHHWRISTMAKGTADEKGVIVADLLTLNGLRPADMSDVIISSVVPESTGAYTEMSSALFKIEPLIVDTSLIKGVKIDYKYPAEIGADRLVNALAGYRLFSGPLIVVDFGTATTFDVITKEGAYLGGVIAPGVEISANALFKAAAKLSHTELRIPDRVIGEDTASSLRAGIVLGAAAMVDGLVERIREELDSKFKVIATGGLAELIAPQCNTVSHTEPFLTLLGLQMVFADRISG